MDPARIGSSFESFLEEEGLKDDVERYLRRPLIATSTSVASRLAWHRLAPALHDDTPFDRFDFAFGVWAALFGAMKSYATLLQAEDLGAAAISDAEHDLSKQIEREVVTALLHEVDDSVDRRVVLEEMKGDLSEQMKANPSDCVPFQFHLAPSSVAALWQRIDFALAPLWRELTAAEPGPGTARALLARHFAEDTPRDGEWHFVRSAGPRLHLQSKTSPHRVWLEREGRRTFAPEAPLDVGVFGPLEVHVAHPEIRHGIERAWASHMIREGWLELEWESEQSLVLCAYPGLAGSFRRHILLNPVAPAASAPHETRPLCPQDLGLWQDRGLALWNQVLPLPELLWGRAYDARRVQAHGFFPYRFGGRGEEFECRVVSCTGVTCEHPLCSARQTRGSTPSWEQAARAHFQDSVERVLRPALLQHHRALLVTMNDLPLREDGRRLVAELLARELAPVIANAADARDCRRAYAEVVVSFAEQEAALREEAERFLIEELALEELQHPLDASDTRRFWRLVDTVLEEEWVGHGFHAEERRKAEWRKWDAIRG